MNTNTRQRLNGLDHLRTLAITLVFLYHYVILSQGQPVWLADLSKFFWSGVVLFFVLSGFLISSQLFAQIREGESISFRDFFLKRFFRIMPAFWVTLAIYFCFPFFREREHLPPLWKFLSFTQNFGLDYKNYGTFSHAWSLCVEEHFYFFLPLMLIFLQRRKWTGSSAWILLILFLAGIALRFLSYKYLYLPLAGQKGSWGLWYTSIYYPSWNRLDGLIAGVGLAALVHFRPVLWSRISRYGNLFLLVSLAVLAGAWILWEDQFSFAAAVFGYPLVALGYGLMVTGAVSEGSILSRWNSRITRRIAVLSFAVYLTHKGVIHITQEVLGPYSPGNSITLAASLITCALAAALLNIAVEKPFLKVRERVLQRKRVSDMATLEPAAGSE